MSGVSSRMVILGVWLALLMAAAGPAVAVGEAYYNITSVTSEQLRNAVRITISADGAISASNEPWFGQGYYLDHEEVRKQTTGEWSPKCYPQVDRIKLHLNNARSQVGSVAHIGRYPVSHVELIVTPESGGRFGLNLEVVLNKRMRWRYFKLDEYGTYDAYLYDHHDPAWFEAVISPDQRSLVITVASDRLPELRERRRLEDVPAEQRELAVSSAGGLLDIHARNVALSDLVETVSREAGIRMIVDTATQRLVTAELPFVTPREFAERIADCYGLVLNGKQDCWVFSDIIAGTAGAYTSGTTDVIPVRWLTAERARDLLPNFLLDYVRTDEENNSLVVSGSKALADKIRADLEKIDEPPINVTVKALLLETSSARDLMSELGLSYAGDDLRLTTSGTLGEVTYSSLGVLPSEFSAKLQALVEGRRAKVRAQSSVTVTGGQTGEVFAGLNKYIVIRRTLWDQESFAEPVDAGVRLLVTPWTSGGPITMSISTEAKNIGEIDPVSRLPVIDSRTASGVFRVAPGETVVIGGLSHTQRSATVRRIPILGSLPLVGALFRKTIRQEAHSELVLLLTPEIAVGAVSDGEVSVPKEPSYNGRRVTTEVGIRR